MSQKILDECLDFFQKYYLPTILPNPKYKDIVKHQTERNEMTQAGLRVKVAEFSQIGKSCFMGDFSSFIILTKIHNMTNFNVYFESESLWSLLHFVMFGRKSLHTSPMSYSEITQKYDHFLIAQYLIDNGLYIDIQSRWGYSALAESVINCPDLEFAEWLLKNGANPNMKNIFGEITLMDAVKASSIECIKLLCSYGADPRVGDLVGITPIYIGRYHIEASTILNNAKTKLDRKQTKLECEDISYCVVCNVSSKIKKLFVCGKCKGTPRYCSIRCQKRNWKSHKVYCKENINKRNLNSFQELVFKVTSAQGIFMPTREMTTQSHEDLTEITTCNHLEGWYALEDHRKKYQKKRGKKIKKVMGRAKSNNVKNEVVFNEKFIIKVQIQQKNPISNVKIKNLPLLAYNKSRKYTVFIGANKQKRKYKKLSTIVRINRLGKSYFYGWVDSNKRLHVLVDKVLALQPW